MNHTIQPITVLIAIAVLLFAAPNRLEAQRGQGGGGPSPPSARAAAPIDPTGYWVSLVTEDWRFRMGTGVRGEYGRTTVPINDRAREVADSWDPEADEAAGLECKPFGGAGIMRVPGRLNITWLDDNTLQIEADAGMQTRTLHFGPTTPPKDEPTWQGHSVARWEFAGAPPRGQFWCGGRTSIGRRRIGRCHDEYASRLLFPIGRASLRRECGYDGALYTGYRTQQR